MTDVNCRHISGLPSLGRELNAAVGMDHKAAGRISPAGRHAEGVGSRHGGLRRAFFTSARRVRVSSQANQLSPSTDSSTNNNEGREMLVRTIGRVIDGDECGTHPSYSFLRDRHYDEIEAATGNETPPDP